MHPRDRNEPPGLRHAPARDFPPFVTEHVIESCAVHSVSLGWLPAITLEIFTADGTAIVGTMTTEAAIELVEIILDTCERSDADYTAAVIDGLKPEQEPAP